MTKRVLRAIAIPVAAIAAVYGAVTFVGCGGGKDEPTPPFSGHVFLDSIIGPTLTAALGTGHDKDYKFLHNSVSPDGTKMFVVFNESSDSTGAGTGRMGGTSGVLRMYMLNAVELESGHVVKLAENTTTGAAGTISFRSSWAGNSKVVLAAADRVYVIDATTLDVLNTGGTLVTAGQNHDALATTDGQYAILTLRTTNGGYADGAIQLLRLSDYTLMGSATSVCTQCHTRNATLCGLDGVVSSTGANAYGGTIYVAGHGGHFAKVALTIDTTAAEPITIVSNDKLTISSAKFPAGTGTNIDGTSVRKLHDARLDGNTLYWSAYNLDANLKAHYGKINIDGTGLVDIAIDPPTAADMPAHAVDAMPIYCASGQTATAFFPATMTNQAFITVIPKSDIHN